MKYHPEAVCGTPQESLWLPISEDGGLVQVIPMTLEECQQACKELEAKDIPVDSCGSCGALYDADSGHSCDGDTP
jgi:hypothetical protein